MRPEEFVQVVAKGAPAPAYFFNGPETRLKDAAVEALVALVPAGLRDCNVSVHHGFDADLGVVIGAVRTAPLLAPRRVVVLRDLEKMRLGEGAGDLLKAYLSDPSPTTAFVATADGEEPARDLAASPQARQARRHRRGAWRPARCAACEPRGSPRSRSIDRRDRTPAREQGPASPAR